MGKVTSSSSDADLMRARMEARLPQRLERAARVKLQNFIPAHWFAAAASECASMYMDGYFYGAISVCQAYIEALTRFLAEHHKIRVLKDVETRCRRLREAQIISKSALDAALSIMENRNDFHHLNREVPADYEALLVRAESCINNLHIIESEVFAYNFEPPGVVAPKKPEYWPESDPDTIRVYLRNLI
jgi:hypothetical protein